MCQFCDHHFTIFWHSVVQKTINWINGEITILTDNENNGLLQLKIKLFCWVYFTILAIVTLPPGQKVTFFSVGKLLTSFRGDSCLEAAWCISQHCHATRKYSLWLPKTPKHRTLGLPLWRKTQTTTVVTSDCRVKGTGAVAVQDDP